MDERIELLERLKLAHAECRAEIALGWDRARTFLALSAAAGAFAISAPMDRELRPLIAVFAALLPLSGLLVLFRSHARYRTARSALQKVESWLDYEPIATTGGARAALGAPRAEFYSVRDVLMLLFSALTLLDIGFMAYCTRWL